MNLRELALNWYGLLGSVNGAAGQPLMALSDRLGVPIIAALLLGLLGATAPCQVTTNVSALAFVSRRAGTPRAPFLSVLAYLLGKALVYTLVGAVVVVAGRQVVSGAVPAVAVAARRVLGPLMILIGLRFLGLVRLNVSFGEGPSAWLQKRADDGGFRGSFLLGVAFAFAFCPTLFWLFFGLTIPLALRSPLGVIYPPAFALGTTLPLVGLTGLAALGGRPMNRFFPELRRANKVLERMSGVILILAGLNDIFVYWFL